MGQKWVQKAFFQKVIVDHLRSSKKCFQPMSSLFVTRFGPWKIPKCFESGPFLVKNGPAMGQKSIFRNLSWNS